MINFYNLYNKSGLDNSDLYQDQINALGIYNFNNVDNVMHLIKKSPQYAYNYALDVIKGRWEEGEPIIMKNPSYACWYAEDVLKCRWYDAEQHIKHDNAWWNYYNKIFNMQ